MAGEIPDVVNQLLLWKSMESLVVFFLILALIGFWVWAEIKTFKFARKIDKENDERMATVAVWGGVGMFVRLFLFAIIESNFNLDWLQIMIAPKLYLLEYAMEVVK